MSTRSTDEFYKFKNEVEIQISAIVILIRQLSELGNKFVQHQLTTSNISQRYTNSIHSLRIILDTYKECLENEDYLETPRRLLEINASLNALIDILENTDFNKVAESINTIDSVFREFDDFDAYLSRMKGRSEKNHIDSQVNEQMNKISLKIDESINSIDLKDKFEILKEMESNAKDVIEKAANKGLVVSYKILANKEFCSANIWRIIGLFFFILAICFALFNFHEEFYVSNTNTSYNKVISSINAEFNKSVEKLVANKISTTTEKSAVGDKIQLPINIVVKINDEDKTNNLLTIFIKFLFTSVILLPAWYAIRESSRHRFLADRANQILTELATFEFFIIKMDEPDKNVVRKMLTEKYFGNNFQYHGAINDMPHEVVQKIFDKFMDKGIDAVAELFKLKVSEHKIEETKRI